MGKMRRMEIEGDKLLSKYNLQTYFLLGMLLKRINRWELRFWCYFILVLFWNSFGFNLSFVYYQFKILDKFNKQ